MGSEPLRVGQLCHIRVWHLGCKEFELFLSLVLDKALFPDGDVMVLTECSELKVVHWFNVLRLDFTSLSWQDVRG